MVGTMKWYDSGTPGDTGVWRFLSQGAKGDTGAGAKGDTGATGTGITYDTTLASDHAVNGHIVPITAGTTLSFGSLTFVTSTGTYMPTNASATTSMSVAAMTAATINNGASGNVLLQGYIRDDSWSLTTGTVLYASAATLGAITAARPTTSGNQVQAVGYAIAYNKIYFNPNNTVVEVV